MRKSMTSSSGNCSSDSPPPVQNSGSEGDLRTVMDQKKRKRMQSNRESARRSRQRKQKHLDDLMGQVSQLKKENNQISTRINVTTQHYVNVEAENSVLRAQMMELTQRLHSLNEILSYIDSSTATAAAGVGSCMFEADAFLHQAGYADSFSNNPRNSMVPNHHPIMASSAEMFDY